MRMPLCFASLFLLVVASTGGSTHADVTLPPFISGHMVLQRESKAPLWGTAAPGEKVTVCFRDQEQQATADADGKWRVELKGLKVGGPDDLIIEGKNTIKLTDVLVGDVWVGSGQSNMAGNVGGYAKNDPVLDKMRTTAYPQIRGCKANGAWTVSTPET